MVLVLVWLVRWCEEVAWVSLEDEGWWLVEVISTGVEYALGVASVASQTGSEMAPRWSEWGQRVEASMWLAEGTWSMVIPWLVMEWERQSAVELVWVPLLWAVEALAELCSDSVVGKSGLEAESSASAFLLLALVSRSLA